MSGQEELAWLAFCYASDELSPEAASEFENRLAADQAAREALAEAALLISATQAALREEPYSVGAVSPAEHNAQHRNAQHGKKRSLGWIVVAAAACIAMVVVADGWIARQHRGQPVIAVNDSDASLALAWADSQFPLDVGDRELLAGSEEYEYGDDTNSITVPDWMLEAVSVRKASEPPAPTKES
jgi:hypothetical protein